MDEIYLGVRRALRANAARAAAAIAELADIEQGRFWRDSTYLDRAGSLEPGRLFPTASLACCSALLQLELREDSWRPPQVTEELMQAVHDITRSRAVSELGQSSLTDPSDGPPSFTVALLLQAVCLDAIISGNSERLASLFDELVKSWSDRISPDEFGPDAHPFVLSHLARALEQTRNILGDVVADGAKPLLQEIYSSIESVAVPLLAEYHSGRTTPSDLVALAFCGVGLAQDDTGSRDRYVMSAIRAAAEGQESSGCWALGRLVRLTSPSATEHLEIEISTYEIAGALADAVSRLCARASVDLLGPNVDVVLDALVRSASFMSASPVTVRSHSERSVTGWCSDHPFNAPRVESWTSANVAVAAVHIDRLLRTVESHQARSHFTVMSPTDPSWPAWLRWSRFRSEGEMDHDARVLDYLHEKLVGPIATSSDRLPSPRTGSVSALLFGPPGTSKTTIVKGIADGLSWPLVELNPGVFINDGLELIEATASTVFKRLMRMERVVVMFDECDELFRERGPLLQSEQLRNITAFVTASMLPKLQELHDHGRVVFFICTNNFASLDSAVKRRGRIDHIIGIGPPDEEARRRIVVGFEVDGGPKLSDVSRLWQGTERFTRGEMVHLAQEFLSATKSETYSDGPQLDALAARLIEGMQASLNIDRGTFEEFRGQLRKSMPHMRLENR